MNDKTFTTLEFDKILNSVKTFAISDKTKEQLNFSIVETDYDTVVNIIEEVDNASTMLRYRHVELGGISDIKPFVKRAQIGSILGVSDFNKIKSLLNRKNMLESLLKAFETDEIFLPSISPYITTLEDIHFLYKRITETVDEVTVLDHASPDLLRIRRKIGSEEQKIRDRLNDIVRKNQKKLSDSIITMRNGRYVIPVNVDYRNEFKGIIHDSSQSGQTIYLEPSAIVDMTNNISGLKEEEQAEITRILADLTNQVNEVAEDLYQHDKNLHHIDFVFARAKYGAHIKGTKPQISEDESIRLIGSFHPLIDSETVVKNDIIIEPETKAVIITGPNTGGKTVTIKTVGLSVLMAQAGIPIPARDGSSISVFKNVYADIGDEQSIEQSLSTFSSHMTNIANILKAADQDSLIILDELGAGTDPEEGAALAISIIEYLLDRQSKIISTTHYPQLKSFSYTREDVINASVEFDVSTLSPTYRLLMGIPGKSNAFEISDKLGLNGDVIERARNLTGRDNMEVNDMITALERHTTEARQHEHQTRELMNEAEKLQKELTDNNMQFKAYKEKLMQKAKDEANRIVKQREQEAAEIIKELEMMKSLGADSIQEHELINAKKELSDSYYQSDIKKDIRNETEEVLQTGDEVDVLTYGQKGEVIGLNGDEVTVQMGIIKMKLDKSEVKKRKAKKAEKPVTIRQNKTHVNRTLDLRGERYEDALIRLEHYLDQVLLSNFSDVEIIHGKGTGALQKGVQQYLKRHPKVASFRGGMPSEGGFGVTIVEMK
ncbi:Endonuclease MutS2 [Jeotgalicoccus aerolatus]|uniref:Endonuclease MutS2 n=1 Tax=Jeotgalicoccus aerolatus TaxID=709510 RepID=A0A1G8VBM1_9STAP|nr:endonuclease MutS2 [Jeotgalicoccus aerolatus]MBP1951957.1 DNA mismatch repair protein MutS2 [Jeotgalicoccus aerolatus]CAD2074814.1 Endonuclease MutS2 [Jeotgalicoccus aerolatus]SDJ63481.1 DNA mismatch repair protein MutS2 [Jeotgalicoccus aerolatus]GGD93347.1 endonuclease MutS2 [Jeotgalicoccus aerolatus]HJG32358.1 endonuclease MutS2 [Jeotgalicoccus aerolatus]